VSSALVNFLENAVDACIADRTKQAHTVVLSVSGDHEWVVFDIHDNGTGIDQETLDRMFTLFFSSKGSKGTGLGLYIANKVVRQHGGSIAVDSTPGQGTNFTIRLPREVPPECLRGEDPDEIAAAANEEPGTAEKTAAPKAGAPGNGKGDRPYCAWIGDMADDE
jgi:K+-sensing histidine kinase KdpD